MKKNGFCGSTPTPPTYVAANVRNPTGKASEEVMRNNYHLRLLKIYYAEDVPGQSAGGGNYVYPQYTPQKELKPKMNRYNSIDSVYKKYDIKPCYL